MKINGLNPEFLKETNRWFDLKREIKTDFPKGNRPKHLSETIPAI